MANGVDLLDVKEASRWASNYLKRNVTTKPLTEKGKSVFTEMIDNERN